MAHSWTRLAGALIFAVMFVSGFVLIDLMTGDEVRPLGQLGAFVAIAVMAYIWPAYHRWILDDRGRLTRRRILRFAVESMAGILVAAAGILFAREYGFVALVVLVMVLVIVRYTVYPHVVRLVRPG